MNNYKQQLEIIPDPFSPPPTPPHFLIYSTIGQKSIMVWLGFQDLRLKSWCVLGCVSF